MPVVTHHRVLAIDVGERRVGLAISDASATLARPLLTLAVQGVADAAEQVVRELERLAGEEDGLSAIVVGRPLRLDGSPSPATANVDAFVTALRTRTRLPINWEDERLTSREAEARLAVRERDWRQRKKKLDAAAAAIILQDFLDRPRQ
jgi:putative holliday junction resolvase